MDISFTERIAIALVVFAAAVLAAALYLWGDQSAHATAYEILGSGVAFVAAYGAWYRSRIATPAVGEKVESAAPSPGDEAASEYLRQRRARSSYLTCGACAVVLAVAVVIGLSPLWRLNSLFSAACVLVFALAAAYAAFLYFPTRSVEGTAERQPLTGSISNAAERTEPAQGKILDLLTVGYERGAERYENIYRAIWQNFSYMTVVAAGILTFGQRSLSRPVLAFLVLTPLFFWYMATFLPLDYYGDKLRQTLARTEKSINEEAKRPGLLDHYSDYAQNRYWWRVRDIVRVFGTILVFLWITTFAMSGVREYQREFGKPGVGDFSRSLSAEINRYERSQMPVDTATMNAVRRLEVLIGNQRAFDSARALNPTARQPIIQSAP